MNNEILGVFKPKFYSLRDLIILTIIIVILLLVPGIIAGFLGGIAIKEEGRSAYILLLSIIGVLTLTIIIAGYLIYLMRSYRTICYTFYKDKLILRCGVFKSIIFYSQIKKIYEKVGLDYLAAVRLGIFLENYALGPTYLCGYGWITLYATDCKNVIVIETEKKRYGITPQESERFLGELKAKLESGRKNRFY